MENNSQLDIQSTLEKSIGTSTESYGTGSGPSFVTWFFIVVFFIILTVGVYYYFIKGTLDLNKIMSFLPSFQNPTSFFSSSGKTTSPPPSSIVSHTTIPVTSVQNQQDEINDQRRIDADEDFNQTGGENEEKTQYDADDSVSNIQQSKSLGKAGWCYIGEDRGFRSCAKVNETDLCMSGDIFPTEDKCVNPKLRWS